MVKSDFSHSYRDIENLLKNLCIISFLVYFVLWLSDHWSGGPIIGRPLQADLFLGR